MAENLFSEKEKRELTDAIAEAESHTSGEIRLHIERFCREDVMDHAAFIFEKLEMHKTERRNAVLFYISFEDHKLAILGDAGIHEKVGDNFWEEIKNDLVEAFKKGEYVAGLSKGLIKAGKALSTYFPKGEDNPNELSNEISFGKSVKK